MATFIETKLGKISITVKKGSVFGGEKVSTSLVYSVDSETSIGERVRSVQGDIYDTLSKDDKKVVDDLILIIENQSKLQIGI